jgi:tRNA pseudouridine38-40 synthase
MGKHYIGHVSYKGSSYYGWQKQKDVPTIQETVFNCIRELYPLGRIDVKATSRTDRGVNALAQVVKFLAPRKEDPAVILKALNEKLPEDIVFTQLERIHKSFKVNYLPLFKEYVYFFTTGEEKLGLPFVGHFERDFTPNLERMRAACQEFEGIHNFVDFQYRSDVKGDFKRQIFTAQIVKANELFSGFKCDDDIYCFHVKGKGFLKQMVRLMVGSMCLVGTGQLPLERLRESLAKDVTAPKSSEKVAFIAPPQGLFLYHIEFPEVSVNERKRHVIDERKFLSMFPDFELWRQDDGASFLIELPKQD